MEPIALLDHVREQMRAVSLMKLSAACGVSTRQLERIRGGLNYPSIATLQAVSDGLKRLSEAAAIEATQGEPATDPAGQPRRPARATATSANGDGSGRVGQQAA